MKNRLLALGLLVTLTTSLLGCGATTEVDANSEKLNSVVSTESETEEIEETELVEETETIEETEVVEIETEESTEYKTAISESLELERVFELGYTTVATTLYAGPSEDYEAVYEAYDWTELPIEAVVTGTGWLKVYMGKNNTTELYVKDEDVFRISEVDENYVYDDSDPIAVDMTDLTVDLPGLSGDPDDGNDEAMEEAAAHLANNINPGPTIWERMFEAYGFEVGDEVWVYSTVSNVPIKFYARITGPGEFERLSEEITITREEYLEHKISF